MRIGILCYATPTGLGYQTLAYTKHLNPSKVLLVDLSEFNHMPIHKEWYDQYNVQYVKGIPHNFQIDEFLNDLDVVLLAETPLNYYLFSAARIKGVKVVQAYNYEFFDYFNHPQYPYPAIFAAPTSWNIDKVKQQVGVGDNVVVLPVPVDRDKIPFREIRECKTFAHIIGRPAYMDRNGTLAFLDAISYIGDKFKYVIYLQPPTDPRAIEYFAPVKEAIERTKKIVNLEIIENTPNNVDMYSKGDVLVLPRRYGGLCLPMQEALSAGMPVIMTDISPNDDILSKDWLVSASKSGEFKFHASVDVYEADTNDLINKMLQFSNDDVMIKGNKMANMLAMDLSWEKLKPIYLEFLNNVHL